MAAFSAFLGVSLFIELNLYTIFIYIHKHNNVLSTMANMFDKVIGIDNASIITFTTIVLIPVYFVF